MSFIWTRRTRSLRPLEPETTTEVYIPVVRPPTPIPEQVEELVPEVETVTEIDVAPETEAVTEVETETVEPEAVPEAEEEVALPEVDENVSE